MRQSDLISREELGARMREVREKHDLTQGQLIDMMRGLELRAGRTPEEFVTPKQSALSKIERGRTWPSTQVFSIFCRALKVSPEWLLR